MKKGITITQRFELENVTSVDNLTDAIFTYKENEKEGSADTDFLLIKKMSNDDVTFDDGKFIIPLSQADTLKLTRIYYIEAQLIYTSGATNKWNIAKKSMRPTLRTENVNGQSDGSEVEDLRMTIDDVFANGGGGTTSDYNELENKPKINNVTLSGNKTSENLGLASASDLNAKADKSDTYTKSETNNLLSGKQNTITGGNGIDVSSDVVSVDIIQGSYLGFENGKLFLYSEPLGHNKSFRQYLVDTAYQNPLASKTYVDNLMSGATKWEFVNELPTENIDIHTIYFVPKESAETDNIYDEWVYAIKSRNPDVYDWELLGTSQVDLSNYYTKSQTNVLLLEKESRVNANIIKTVNNHDESEKINVTQYSYASFSFDTLNSGEELTLIKYINNTETNRETLTNDHKYAYVFDCDSISFYFTGDRPSLSIRTNLSNEVIRQRQYSQDIVELQRGKQDKIDTDHKLSADLLQDGSTNKPSNWNAKSKIFDAVMVSGEISNDVSNYPNIQLGDIAINRNTNQIWLQRTSPSTTVAWYELEYSKAKTTKSENNPSTSGNGNVGDIWIKGSQVWVLTNRAGNYPPYTLTWTEVTQDLSAYQPLIDSTHKLSADLVDDTNSTNKFVTSTEKSTWNGKADNTTISTDTTSTTVSLTLADNHEYRYTQDLTSLTLTMPSGNFISSIVFASGSTPTSMTYDSSIKWSGDDVTNGQFVPSADKDYDIMMYYNGLNVNGIVRGV